MLKIGKILLISSSALILAACRDGQTDDLETPVEEEQTGEVDPRDELPEDMEDEEGSALSGSQEVESVTVTMLNNEGEEVGTAVFEDSTEGGVLLNLNLEGIPAGEYGMHIHEVGSATPPDFEDAGGHFNPTDVDHGINTETGPHVGGLPNLVVPEDGVVEEVIEIPNTSLRADDENSLNSSDGTALIVHTGADDYESQPTGDAGDRMLGGVIFEGTGE